MQITGFLFGLTEQNRLTINHAIKKLFAEQGYQVQQLLQRGHLIKATVKDLNPKEPANKSYAPQAYRASEARGNNYSHAGCLSKIINKAIRLLCKPRRVGFITAICFVSQFEKVQTFRCTAFRAYGRSTAH